MDRGIVAFDQAVQRAYRFKRHRLGVFLAVVLLGASGAALAIDTEPAFGDEAMQARYEKLVEELRCLVCQNQTIADSDAPLAQDLRAQVREMLGDGATDKQILTYMTERYGDFVRYRPEWSPRTWAVWLGPFVLLGIGLFVVARVVAKRVAMPFDNNDPADDLPQDPGSRPA